MRILNLNTRTEIGANCWLVELDRHKLLIDAGIHPKLEGKEALPLFNLIRQEKLDAIIITHCHHDHIGALPVAMRLFPQTPVFMTELSYCIAERILHNSVNVMTNIRFERGVIDYPLYTHEEVSSAVSRFYPSRFFKPVEWPQCIPKRRSSNHYPTVVFYDAGHTMGAAGIWIGSNNESIFYTGDVCFHDQTLQRGARFEGIKASVLIIETTRGNRPAKNGISREIETERLLYSIKRVLARKGSVLIPTFALGRTQEVLALLALWMRNGLLKPQPIYVGGLGLAISEAYDLYAHKMFRHHYDLRLNRELDLIVLDRFELQTIRPRKSKIFVLTAGMMNENTGAHDLALRLMPEERHAIFFVGYTDPDTPGGRLKNSKIGEPFYFSDVAGETVRYCEVDEFDLTAHANREALLDFVGEVQPELVILTHGGTDSIAWFKAQLADRYPNMQVVVPLPGEYVTTD